MSADVTTTPPAPIAAAEPVVEDASDALRRVAGADPEFPALSLDGEITTYAELDRAVDRVAARLVADHGRFHPFIALRIAETRAMAIASLAVQRAGMVYVPVDPTAPSDRVAAIVAEVGPALLLTDIPDEGSDWNVRIEQVADYTAVPPAGGVIAEPGELAAVVFTSGSTGVPKGIVHTVAARRAGARLVSDLCEQYPTGTWRLGSFTVGTVGLADGMIHTTVLLGATFVGYDFRKRGLTDWSRWAREERIAATVLIPTIWRFLAPTLTPDETFPDLGLVVMIGEASTWDDVRELDRHLPEGAVISNFFGQTEVMVSRFDIRPDTPRGEGRLPAGTPLVGREVVIADEDGVPVAPGAAGEILVTTTAAAGGYWNRPEETARTFVPCPDGRTCVHTGDAGRLLPDGSLQHLGRLDDMVKISGNRVELAEIEAALRGCEGVTDAAAATYESERAGLRLRAFVVGDPHLAKDPDAIRRQLSERLPRPLLPDVVEMVDELPRLAGGKVDRRELAARPRPDAAADQAPADPFVQSVAELFAAALEMASVGLDDNFFALGGDSLRAAQLFAALEDRLGVQQAVSAIFQAPTVSSLAARLRAEPAWDSLVTVREGEPGWAPLVVVHDGYGDVLYANRIAQRLDAAQPVLGLRSRAAVGLPPEDGDLVDVAARYVRELRAARPHGPYQFYGWSLGGTLAFEMATQLQAAGEEISLLALGDSPGPLLEAQAYDLRSRLHRRWRQVRAEPPFQAVRLTGRLAARQVKPAAMTGYGWVGRRFGWLPQTDESLLDDVLAAGGEVPRELRQAFSLRCYAPMLLRYQPTRRFEGSALLVCARSHDDRPDRGWSPWVTGSLRVVEIATHHGEPWAGAAGEVHLDTLRAACAAAQP